MICGTGSGWFAEWGVMEIEGTTRTRNFRSTLQIGGQLQEGARQQCKASSTGILTQNAGHAQDSTHLTNRNLFQEARLRIRRSAKSDLGLDTMTSACRQRGMSSAHNLLLGIHVVLLIPPTYMQGTSAGRFVCRRHSL